MEKPTENEIIDFALNFFNLNDYLECPIREIREKFTLSKSDIIFINNCIDRVELYDLIIFSGNTHYSAKLTLLGNSVIEQGGWIKYLENKKQKAEFENRKQIAELENIETTTQVNKFLIKTKWLPHSLAFFSFVFAVFIYFDARNDNKKLTQRIENLENIKNIK